MMVGGGGVGNEHFGRTAGDPNEALNKKNAEGQIELIWPSGVEPFQRSYLDR